MVDRVHEYLSGHPIKSGPFFGISWGQLLLGLSLARNGDFCRELLYLWAYEERSRMDWLLPNQPVGGVEFRIDDRENYRKSDFNPARRLVPQRGHKAVESPRGAIHNSASHELKRLTRTDYSYVTSKGLQTPHIVVYSP